MINFSEMLHDIEMRRRILNVPVAALCRKAGITAPSYRRWRAGGSFQGNKLLKLVAAIEALEHENAPE